MRLHFKSKIVGGGGIFERGKYFWGNIRIVFRFFADQLLHGNRFAWPAEVSACCKDLGESSLWRRPFLEWVEATPSRSKRYNSLQRGLLALSVYNPT